MPRPIALLGAFLAVLLLGAAATYLSFREPEPVASSGLSLSEAPAAPPAPAPPPAQSSLAMLASANRSVPQPAAAAPAAPAARVEAPRPAAPPPEKPAPKAAPVPRLAPGTGGGEIAAARSGARWNPPSLSRGGRASAAASGGDPPPEIPAPEQLAKLPPVVRELFTPQSSPRAETRRVYMQRVYFRCIRYFLNDPPPGEIQSRDGLRVEVSYQYYDVQGQTAEEICADIARNKAPPDMDPGGWGKLLERGGPIGVTYHTIRPSAKAARRGEQCRVSDASVEVKADVTLPRWNGSEPPELVARWNRLATAVKNHEDTHAFIAAQEGEALLGDLRAIGEEPCGQFQQEVQRRYDARSQEDRERQKKFDYDTSQTQSVRF